MQQIRVKDLAVSLTAYATVNAEATLYDAVIALDDARYGFDPRRLKHRAILVLDDQQQVIGKIGFHQVLQGLEPKYAEIPDKGRLSGTFTAEFIKEQIRKYALWDKPLDDICRKSISRLSWGRTWL